MDMDELPCNRYGLLRLDKATDNTRFVDCSNGMTLCFPFDKSHIDEG
jgi:hypothetical protein